MSDFSYEPNMMIFAIVSGYGRNNHVHTLSARGPHSFENGEESKTKQAASETRPHVAFRCVAMIAACSCWEGAHSKDGLDEGEDPTENHGPIDQVDFPDGLGEIL